MKIMSRTLAPMIILIAAVSYAQSGSNSSSLIETPASPPKAADTTLSQVDTSTPSTDPSEAECQTKGKKKRWGKQWKHWNRACLKYKKHGRSHDGKHDDQADKKNYEDDDAKKVASQKETEKEVNDKLKGSSKR